MDELETKTPVEVDEKQIPLLDPPPVVEEPEADPNVLGALEQGELGILTALQQQARAIVLRIGELDVERMRMHGQLHGLEQQNQQQLQTVATRLNIPQGTQWQVTNDGKVMKVAQPTPFRPQVVPSPK